jgi:hypothetical protein
VFTRRDLAMLYIDETKSSYIKHMHEKNMLNTCKCMYSLEVMGRDLRKEVTREILRKILI